MLIKSSDLTYVNKETGFLGYIEVASGLICCYLPILALFWHHLSHSTGSGGGRHNNNTLTLDRLTKPKHNQTNRGGHESYVAHEPVGGEKLGAVRRREYCADAADSSRGAGGER
ncbi:MAG: hypothetical protein L6R36_001603 [Xanthoria steineri]|nr:MAG: hypothetical protein L6R36_001603 [Xanthoria steineri]